MHRTLSWPHATARFCFAARDAVAPAIRAGSAEALSAQADPTAATASWRLGAIASTGGPRAHGAVL